MATPYAHDGVLETPAVLALWPEREYPRETPKGDQTDIVESMDLENGLITHHRVYWGWVGFSKLHNAINKARQCR
jgi:hypothetical protein